MTEKQQQIFDFIVWFQSETGYPPSRSEMATAFGVAVNAISDRLKAIERKGFIEVDKGISRGIRIL